MKWSIIYIYFQTECQHPAQAQITLDHTKPSKVLRTDAVIVVPEGL